MFSFKGLVRHFFVSVFGFWPAKTTRWILLYFSKAVLQAPGSLLQAAGLEKNNRHAFPSNKVSKLKPGKHYKLLFKSIINNVPER